MVACGESTDIRSPVYITRQTARYSGAWSRRSTGQWSAADFSDLSVTLSVVRMGYRPIITAGRNGLQGDNQTVPEGILHIIE